MPAPVPPTPAKIPTPQENLDTVLSLTTGADDYTRRAAVLTAYAESDFNSAKTQGASIGIYQQIPRWWPSATQGSAAQCKAFLVAFAAITRTNDLVRDCYQVQRWAAPDPAVDPGGFRAAPETVNYLNRVAAVPQIIAQKRLP